MNTDMIYGVKGNEKNWLRLILGLFVIGIVAYILSAVLYFSLTYLSVLSGFCLTLSKLLALTLLIQDGSLRHTKFWRIILLLLSVGIIGALLKILHWAGADVVLPIALGGIAVVYAIHFFKKPKKGHLDVLKLVWVLSYFTSSVLTLGNWDYLYLGNLPTILFWITFLDFYFTRIRPEYIRN